MRQIAFVLLVTLACALCAAVDGPHPGVSGEGYLPAPTTQLPHVALERLFKIERPTYAVHDPNGRMFFLEQPGRVRLMENGRLLDTPYLDISKKVTLDYECGLLSIAFHPKFLDNGYVYADYTATSPNLKTFISEFHVDPASKQIDPSTERVVMTINQPYVNHKGGQLQFGPDGFLYIGMGDGGNQRDPHGNGQNPQVLLGKMLRIDVTPRQAYGIPPDGPLWKTSGAPARPLDPRRRRVPARPGLFSGAVRVVHATLREGKII